jgi:hypothetical protein
MKYINLPIVLTLALFLGGCAETAYYADREHGLASRDAFDQQIAHKDYKYAGMPVEGLDAIYAEHIMGKYLDTFQEGFTKEKIDISSMSNDWGTGD